MSMKQWGKAVALVGLCAAAVTGCDEDEDFDGLEMSLSTLPLLSDAQTRSISPENFTGEKGMGGMATEGTGANAARELGQGWKVSPSVRIAAGETFTLADIEGPGAIQHIWMTPTGNWRFSILRFYWDGEAEPSVEVPVGDFFANGWGQFAHVNSLAVAVNPGSGFNSYWTMPFRRSGRITLENLDDRDMVLYYQIDYTLTDVPSNAGYFHAQFRRSNPVPDMEDYTILDGVIGQGQYVGTYMCWGSNSPGSWTATSSFRPSAVRVPRITSAAPTAFRIPKPGTTWNSARPTPGCPR